MTLICSHSQFILPKPHALNYILHFKLKQHSHPRSSETTQVFFCHFLLFYIPVSILQKHVKTSNCTFIILYPQMICSLYRSYVTAIYTGLLLSITICKHIFLPHFNFLYLELRVSLSLDYTRTQTSVLLLHESYFSICAYHTQAYNTKTKTTLRCLKQLYDVSLKSP